MGLRLELRLTPRWIALLGVPLRRGLVLWRGSRWWRDPYRGRRCRNRRRRDGLRSRRLFRPHFHVPILLGWLVAMCDLRGCSCSLSRIYLRSTQPICLLQCLPVRLLLTRRQRGNAQLGRVR